MLWSKLVDEKIIKYSQKASNNIFFMLLIWLKTHQFIFTQSKIYNDSMHDLAELDSIPEYT